MNTPAFANLLFSGRCNLRCPRCIGHTLDQEAYPDNLRQWPLSGLDAFLDRVGQAGIREVSVTGTNTDPQLYEHQGRLVAHIRTRLPDVRLSLHTNGVLALARMAEFNLYDRATISVSSFDPAIYRRMTGGREVPDVAAILARARIPVKISVLLDDANRAQWESHLEACRRLGVRRVVFRHTYGETRREHGLLEWPGEAAVGAPVHVTTPRRDGLQGRARDAAEEATALASGETASKPGICGRIAREAQEAEERGELVNRPPSDSGRIASAAQEAEEPARGVGSTGEVLAGETPVRTFMGNPVYDWHGMEVTVWHFEATRARCINLFSNGEIRDDYLLERRAVA